MSKQPGRPEPGQHDPWFMLGYLRSGLNKSGVITQDDWAEALEAAEREYERKATA